MSSRSSFTRGSGPPCNQAPPIDRSLLYLTRYRSSSLGKVIIKSAPKYRLNNERDVVNHFHARQGIRQLLDETQDPPSLVLKYLDDNLLAASNSKRLGKPEIKFIAKRILEALQAFHEDGYVHTGISLPLSL
jgi:casein kinase II subunit alpha